MESIDLTQIKPKIKFLL